MNSTKTCSKCGKTKPLSEFYKDKNSKDGKYSSCKKCKNIKSEKYRKDHRNKINKHNRNHYEKHREKYGYQSMYENKFCSSYLGIVIAERLIRYLFNDVEVMPFGNPKFDFICNKGKLIDVKSACITYVNNGKYSRWQFTIRKNTTADFFILVAFDNRTDLNPLHLWMIPGKELNQKGKISISLSTLHKWDKCEMNIEDAQICCAEMKDKMIIKQKI